MSPSDIGPAPGSPGVRALPSLVLGCCSVACRMARHDVFSPVGARRLLSSGRFVVFGSGLFASSTLGFVGLVSCQCVRSLMLAVSARLAALVARGGSC